MASLENPDETKAVTLFKPKIIKSFAHKWTIDNFYGFFTEENELLSIESDKFHPKDCADPQFYLEFYPQGHSSSNSQSSEPQCLIRVFVKSSRYMPGIITISIIDSREEKCYGFSNIFRLTNNDDYLCLDHSIPLLKIFQSIVDGKLKLYFEVGIIDGPFEVNGSHYSFTKGISSLIPMTETYFNVKPIILKSFALKWTINNFLHFYEEEWKGLDFIQSEREFNEIGTFSFFMHPNGNEELTTPFCSLVLRTFMPKNATLVMKLSILDQKDKKVNSQILSMNLNEIQNNPSRSINVVISGFEKTEILKIYGEVKVFENNEYTMQMSKRKQRFVNVTISENVPIKEFTFDAKPQVIESIEHKWTIENFRYFYDKECPDSIYRMVVSNDISSNIDKNLQFSLRLLPKGLLGDSDYVYMIVKQMEQNEDHKIQVKVSFLDKENRKLKTMVVNRVDPRSKMYGYELHGIDFKEIFNKFLVEEKLIIYSQIQVIKNEKSLQSYKIQSSVPTISESHSNPKARVNGSLAHKWIIDNFKYFYSVNNSCPLFIESEAFWSTDGEHKFCLRLNPDGDDANADAHHSIYSCSLQLASFGKNIVNLQILISLLDDKGNKQESEGKNIQISQNQCVTFDLLLYQFHRLKSLKKLKLLCEIQIMDIKNSNLNKGKLPVLVTESLSNAKPQIIESHTHKWNIENFDYLFAAKEIGNIIIEGFSLLFTNSKFEEHFKLIFCPLGSKDVDNYCSIYLQNISEEKMQILLKITFINEVTLECYSKAIILKFNTINLLYGFDKFISVQKMKKKFLIDSTLKLICELNVIGDKKSLNISKRYKVKNYNNRKRMKSQSNKLASSMLAKKKISDEPTNSTLTESTFKLKPKTANDFSHKWTIANFVHLYDDGACRLTKMFSNKFLTRNNAENLFQLVLETNIEKNPKNEYLSLFLEFFETGKSKQNLRILSNFSILDKDGNKCNTKIPDYENLYLDILKVEIFISIDELLGSEHRYLPDGQLTIICEGTLFDFETKNYTPNEHISKIQNFFKDSTFSDFNIFFQEWTIRNFRFFFEQKEYELFSENLIHPNWPEVQFYWKLTSCGNEADDFSVFLFSFQSFPRDSKIAIEFLILDSKKTPLYSNTLSCSDHDYKCLSKFSISRNVFLDSSDNNLLIYSRIGVVKTNANETIQNLEKNAQNILQKCLVECSSNANVKLIQFEYKWTIENYSSCHKESIKSSVFFPEENEKLKFKLKLQLNEAFEDYVSLSLQPESEDTLFSFSVSIEDCTGSETHTKDGPNKFLAYCKQSFEDCDKYMTCFDILNPENGFLINDTLTICCKIKVVAENETNEEDIGIIEEIYNSPKSANITCTKVYSVAHFWVLENYLSHCNTNQDINVFFKSTKFSPLCNDELEFCLELTTDRNKIPTILLLFPETKPNLVVEAMIAIVNGTNLKKSFVCVLEPKHTVQKANLIFLKATFNNSELTTIRNEFFLNGIMQIWCRVNIIDNDSSKPSKNNSSAKYVVAQKFDSPWKVCNSENIETRSRSHTNIPIFNCVQKVTIENFLQFIEQDKSSGPIKSETFSPLDWDNQIEFCLRIYPNGENEESKNLMQIYLHSTKSAVEFAVQAKIWLIDAKGLLCLPKEGDRKRISTGESLEWFDVYHHKTIQTSKDKLLPNTDLTIYCEIDIFPNCSMAEPHLVESICILPELNTKLYEDQPTDVVIECKEDENREQLVELHAHLAILIARSKHFEAMFSYEMIEQKTRRIQIDNFNSKVIKELLRFLYTGVPFLSKDICIELALAADMYFLYELKQICDDWLKIHPENIPDYIDSFPSLPEDFLIELFGGKLNEDEHEQESTASIEAQNEDEDIDVK